MNINLGLIDTIANSSYCIINDQQIEFISCIDEIIKNFHLNKMETYVSEYNLGKSDDKLYDTSLIDEITHVKRGWTTMCLNDQLDYLRAIKNKAQTRDS